MRLEGGFINNLGRVYGIYTLGFLGFVILMAILEQVSVSADAIGWMFVGFTIAIYVLIGVLSRTMESSEYYVAGREVPAVFNGMATAAERWGVHKNGWWLCQLCRHSGLYHRCRHVDADWAVRHGDFCLGKF